MNIIINTALEECDCCICIYRRKVCTNKKHMYMYRNSLGTSLCMYVCVYARNHDKQIIFAYIHTLCTIIHVATLLLYIIQIEAHRATCVCTVYMSRYNCYSV